MGLVTMEVLRGYENGQKGALDGEVLFKVVKEVAGMFSVIVAGIRDLFMTAAPSKTCQV